MSVDTRVERKRDLSRYQNLNHGDLRLLISRDLAANTRHLRVRLRKFLWLFPYARAEAELLNGQCIGRGPRRVEE